MQKPTFRLRITLAFYVTGLSYLISYYAIILLMDADLGFRDGILAFHSYFDRMIFLALLPIGTFACVYLLFHDRTYLTKALRNYHVHKALMPILCLTCILWIIGLHQTTDHSSLTSTMTLLPCAMIFGFWLLPRFVVSSDYNPFRAGLGGTMVGILIFTLFLLITTIVTTEETRIMFGLPPGEISDYFSKFYQLRLESSFQHNMIFYYSFPKLWYLLVIPLPAFLACFAHVFLANPANNFDKSKTVAFD
ncbi:hypothetical protein [Kiloniella sp.]|uniref:hypothetical protein n=1 Tax=Kiloniella sp. TaxID=1938587 RepID=UPI003B02199D